MLGVLGFVLRRVDIMKWVVYMHVRGWFECRCNVSFVAWKLEYSLGFSYVI